MKLTDDQIIEMCQAASEVEVFVDNDYVEWDIPIKDSVQEFKDRLPDDHPLKNKGRRMIETTLKSHSRLYNVYQNWTQLPSNYIRERDEIYEFSGGR